MEDALNHAQSAIVNGWMLFNHPEHVAKMLEMLPAAIGLIGLGLILFLLVTGGRLHGLRWATVLLYAGGAGLVGWMVYVADQQATWLDHARWIALAAPGVLIALSAIPSKIVRFAAIILALIVAIPTSGAIGIGVHPPAMEAINHIHPTDKAPANTPEKRHEQTQNQSNDHAQPSEKPAKPSVEDHAPQSDQSNESKDQSSQTDQGLSLFGIQLKP